MTQYAPSPMTLREEVTSSPQTIRHLIICIHHDIPLDDLVEVAKVMDESASPTVLDRLTKLVTDLLLFAEHREPNTYIIDPIPHRELLTELALGLSLCPVHLRDYAICFDDEEPSCRKVRAIHPQHDS